MVPQSTPKICCSSWTMSHSNTSAKNFNPKAKMPRLVANRGFFLFFCIDKNINKLYHYSRKGHKNKNEKDKKF